MLQQLLVHSERARARESAEEAVQPRHVADRKPRPAEGREVAVSFIDNYRRLGVSQDVSYSS